MEYIYDAGADYGDPQNAALYVATMVAMAAIGLALMKKSGFRAMVAVGS